MTEGAPAAGVFARHPRLTMAVTTLVLLAPCDYLAGTLTNRLPLASVRHPAYHHGLLPNVDESIPWGQHRYRRATDSLGFRDAERRDVALRSARHRILFIGDSFTEGVGVDYEKTFVGRIAAALAPRGIEVLNAGVQSYAPKLMDLKVRYLIETVGLSFDELEVFVDISDVQDEIMYEPFVPGLTADFVLRRGSDWLTKHSLIARTILDRVRGNWSQSVSRSFGSGGPSERGRWTFDDGIWNRYGRRGMALAQANMERLVDYARARGITVRMSIYPWPEQIRARDRESRQVTLWRAFAQQHALPISNFFPDFMGGDPEATVRSYFMPEDVHWSDEGHALIARRWLEERGYATKMAAAR